MRIRWSLSSNSDDEEEDSTLHVDNRSQLPCVYDDGRDLMSMLFRPFQTDPQGFTSNLLPLFPNFLQTMPLMIPQMMQPSTAMSQQQPNVVPTQLPNVVQPQMPAMSVLGTQAPAPAPSQVQTDTSEQPQDTPLMVGPNDYLLTQLSILPIQYTSSIQQFQVRLWMITSTIIPQISANIERQTEILNAFASNWLTQGNEQPTNQQQ